MRRFDIQFAQLSGIWSFNLKTVYKLLPLLLVSIASPRIGSGQAIERAPSETLDPVRKLYERGLYDRTISAGEQALAKYPKDPALARWVAQSYMFSGKWDKSGAI